MSPVKRGLGKGLSALIPEAPETRKTEAAPFFMGGRTIVNLDLDAIFPNARQPRTDFTSAALEELAQSIRQEGVIQPILVRPRNGAYELIAGERRWRAARIAGLPKIPAIVKDFGDRESLELALIENLQREDLNPLDEALGYAKLQQEFQITQEQIAERVGKHRTSIANALRLLELPAMIRESMGKGEITAGHARALLALDNPDAQISLWQEIKEKNLSVREVELRAPTKSRKSSKVAPQRLAQHPELQPIQEDLTVRLGTRVSLVGTPDRGRIIVDYFSREDLDRIVEILEEKVAVPVSSQTPV